MAKQHGHLNLLQIMPCVVFFQKNCFSTDTKVKCQNVAIFSKTEMSIKLYALKYRLFPKDQCLKLYKVKNFNVTTKLCDILKQLL